MNKKEIEDILNCNNYMDCMKIIYNINPKSFKEDELPKEVREHLKRVRNRVMDINRPIQVRKNK